MIDRADYSFRVIYEYEPAANGPSLVSSPVRSLVVGSASLFPGAQPRKTRSTACAGHPLFLFRHADALLLDTSTAFKVASGEQLGEKIKNHEPAVNSDDFDGQEEAR